MSAVPESHRDLLEINSNMMLATNGADGYPQVTLVSFLFEDDLFKVSLGSGRQKLKNMVRDSRVTIFFLDPNNAYRTLEIRADATVEPDPDFTFADRLGAKYATNLRDWSPPGESRFLVSFAPKKVNTYG